MDNEDLDALAAEYVLGTLAPDERAHAEALIAVDSGFVDIIHQWERRLGELNVMVEAVEPPAEIWDKIKSGVATAAPSEEVRLAPTEPTPPGAEAETKADGGIPSAPLAALAASLSPAEGQPGSAAEAKSGESETRPPGASATIAPVPPAVTQTGRSADVVDLGRRMRRWRGVAVLAGALAAVLAALIVVSQVDPGVIPAGGFHIPQLVAQTTAPPAPAAPPPGSRLVAVLQQEPSTPAFLLTIDPASKTLTVRRVAAKAGAGHSYELWLIPPKSTTPQALGVVGEQEFTQPKLPANVDAASARDATYAISFEPAGGSKTGAPSGPILFTGKLVESVPPPAPPATPKT